MELRSLVNDGDASADAQDGGAGDSSTDTVLARERRVTRTQAARADMRTEYTGGRIPLIVFLVMLVAGAAFLAPGISLLVLFPASTPGSPFLVPLCLTNEGNLTFVSWNYTSDGVCSALSEASAREVSFVIDQSHIEGQRGYRTALLLSDRANASGTVRVTHDDVVLYQVSFESANLVAQRLFVVGGAEVVVHVPIDTDFSGIPLSVRTRAHTHPHADTRAHTLSHACMHARCALTADV
jgi:hypothetical protein